MASRKGLFRLHGGSTTGNDTVGASRSMNTTDSTITDPQFTVLSEKLVYNGWRKVSSKEVIMPNGKNVVFDVITQKEPSVTVFIWDRRTSTATLVQEYHPGVQKMMFGAVAGAFESHKHTTPLECAMAELEEEAQLSCTENNWIPLLRDGSTKVPFEKYSDNQLHPYLALDCTPVINPKPMDDEEFIIIHKNISHSRLMEMISKGELNIISSYTVLLGIQKLIEMGIKLHQEEENN